MKVSRRDFLRLAGASVAALGLTALDLNNLEKVLASSESPPVLWLQGAACSGCSISLLNSVNPTIDSVLLNSISMKYHPNLSTAAGTLAISTITSTESVNSGQFILVIEGGIPTAGSGIYCVIGEKDGTSWTMMDAVNELAPKAKWVVAAGTCASFTGVPGAGSNPLAVQSVETLVGSLISQPVINLPGCPAHPLVMVGTLVDLISGTSLTLDSYNRPTKYYGSAIIHQTCTRRGTGEVSSVGVYGCYMKLGCKGRADSLCIDLCPTRKWNNGVNFCMNTDVPCIGCSSPSFPYSNSAPLMTCYLS